MPRYDCRYIGYVEVYISYVGTDRDGRDEYEGYIIVEGDMWEFDGLYGPVCAIDPEDGDTSEEASIDRMAAAAVSFASYYTTGNRGKDTPEWAPSPEFADRVEQEACSWMDDKGRVLVRRDKDSKEGRMC